MEGKDRKKGRGGGYEDRDKERMKRGRKGGREREGEGGRGKLNRKVRKG